MEKIYYMNDYDSARPNILFLHDVDLGKIDGASETINYLLTKYSKEKNGKAILGVKFPISINGINDFNFW